MIFTLKYETYYAHSATNSAFMCVPHELNRLKQRIWLPIDKDSSYNTHICKITGYGY